MHKINYAPGRELGITGRHEDTPAFEIINEANDQFLALTSRVVGLEYGPLGEVLKRQPHWLVVQSRKVRVLDRLHRMGSNAVEASEICDEIQSIGQAIDLIIASVTTASDEYARWRIWPATEHVGPADPGHFENHVLPTVGARGEALCESIFIAVAGQNGAGKSTNIRNAELGLQGATQRVIGDDFVAYVPGFDERVKFRLRPLSLKQRMPAVCSSRGGPRLKRLVADPTWW